MQLQFNLPEIDRDATKKKVESLLEKYQLYVLQESLDRLPTITAKYTIVPNSNSLPSSQTESAAIANVDYERQRVQFMQWIIRAVNRLTYDERALIVKGYLNIEEEMFDYEVYRELNMSESKYYRLKARAIYRLAFALKVEVYREEVNLE